MLRLLSPLLSSLLKQEFHDATEKAKRCAITGAVIGIFALIGFVFLLLAGFLYLSTLTSQLSAALIMSASAFVIALIAWVITRSINAAKERRRRERLEADKSALMATAALATVPALLKRPILAAALPLAGIALASFLNNKKPDDHS